MMRVARDDVSRPAFVFAGGQMWFGNPQDRERPGRTAKRVPMKRSWLTGACWGRARLVVLGSVLGVAGCSRHVDQKPAPVRTPSRGTGVVVEISAAEFFLGTVLESGRDGLRVQRTLDGAVVRVPLEDVYTLPSAPSALRPNDYGICEVLRGQWGACQILSQVGDEMEIRDGSGESHRIAATRVLAPTGVTELNLRRYFEKSELLRQFWAGAKAAGRPRRPAGWSPASRRPVLGERGTQWFDATVVDVRKRRVVVRWDADGTQTDLAPTAVAPQPPSCGSPEKGRYALLRPAGPAMPWSPVLVVAVSSVDAQVRDERQESHGVLGRDLCPLGEP